MSDQQSSPSREECISEPIELSSPLTIETNLPIPEAPTCSGGGWKSDIGANSTSVDMSLTAQPKEDGLSPVEVSMPTVTPRTPGPGWVSLSESSGLMALATAMSGNPQMIASIGKITALDTTKQPK